MRAIAGQRLRSGNPPESYRGAYVFLNGYDEALLLFGE